ncbi:glutamate receptor 2.7-like isoform X1 [Ipomoea triloba]|uniref:glutamate receptor 2.7-like isoform X1 n=1 Tax=Ipomoea triloba TaxID=35885 RepID=UPI00125D86BE|nr:glutamate receptor 2.7-like isoform X1 [Ipomoea triloba]XP_031104861.1 glutamate receptor 2.7-like isoform X1 [Ipomoea triloba]
MREKNSKRCLSLILAIYLLTSYRELTMANGMNPTKIPVKIGLILDKSSWAGMMGLNCVSFALSDFYASHGHYRTRLVLHFRDSKDSVIGAASAASNLIKDVGVQAIIGPQTSMQANFVISLGDDAKVPIVSFSATSPSLSSLRSKFFIRATLNDSSQVKAISSVIQAFGWRAAVPIYIDTEFGEGIMPYLADALQEVETHIPYRSVIRASATDDELVAELYKLMTMQTRVFIVHMPPTLGIRLFNKAREVGMMSEGYVWIITTGITNHFSLVHPSTHSSMQGVLGIKVHVPKRKKLEKFILRWKRKFPRHSPVDLRVFGLWAYDAARALAIATEEIVAREMNTNNLIDSQDLKVTSLVSEIGKHLPRALSRARFDGLSGVFDIVNGELQSSYFQIVNLMGNKGRGVGFWTPRLGITKKLNAPISEQHDSTKVNIKAIVWPGNVTSIPKGWVIPTNGKKLRIGVPVRSGSNAFVNVIKDPRTGMTTFTGYSIDVFDSVMAMLPYNVPYQYVPFAFPNGSSAGSYDDLVFQVYLGKFDAAAGDITIRANRSKYVDFTQPFIESGITMVVPVKDRRKGAWTFLKPLTWDLWVTSGCFFVFMGFVIWILEHRTNEEFRGSPHQQVGTGFWFSFSIMVFAHKEKVVSHLARFVVIIWCFVVLILTQSYTASLASMLTIQQLEPAVSSVRELTERRENVGYAKGSFIRQLLTMQMNFSESQLKAYDTLDELDDSFSNGGISAAFGEIPYMKLFLAKHCSKYTMVSPTIKTDGFGFVFPIRSPLVPDVSRSILNLTEGGRISGIEKTWFGQQPPCPDESSTMGLSNSLSLHSFWGLFLIVGIASSLAVIIFASILLYQKRRFLKHLRPKDLWRRIGLLSKCFKNSEQNNVEVSSISVHGLPPLTN